MITDYVDIFWFVENVLSKDLSLMPGNIYNLFGSLDKVSVLRNKYYSDYSSYTDEIKSIVKRKEKNYD